MSHSEFTQLIHAKGKELYRDMPWRQDTRPYYILVSELMLQQTQVARVTVKFKEFMTAFPTIESLAAAPLSNVLKVWSGLGYNRRAKFLHQAAKQVLKDYGGDIPNEHSKLMELPGIGTATAGAIMVYAFNQPVAFIETNVRTVYIHHFFQENEMVSDSRLLPLVEATLDIHHPRAFYWALMDYGSWLKKEASSKGHLRSSHYKKQPAFTGSVREMRGRIVRALGEGGMTSLELQKMVDADERFGPALKSLIKDGLVVKADALLSLSR